MIRAIETLYRGVRFRSRMEARWAVFFQSLKLSWDYEPEMYLLSTGEQYLPDFRVKLFDRVLWVEVKPRVEDAGKLVRFMMDQEEDDRHTCGVILGSIPDPHTLIETQEHVTDEGYTVYFPGSWTDEESGKKWCIMDAYYMFCMCPICRAIGFEFIGLSDRIDCECSIGSDFYGHKLPQLITAYTDARSMRF